jgi:hypothetical protein
MKDGWNICHWAAPYEIATHAHCSIAVGLHEVAVGGLHKPVTSLYTYTICFYVLYSYKPVFV